ncbi:EamA family transporter [Actinokineospora xionganensis]|uniref:EamA family transporter n=1 Tax=Actinokineospora xionganensis TaxID=2684470 RepID=A0ABR7L9M5_9PSEU|nr:EamA family transporter [Actinokineospora xionganensis]MBC6449396.1 EamA family transporter [Actinokineospora xionganensis]
MSSKSWFAWTALGVVYVMWGSTYLAIRFTIESMPALLSAGARFLVAGAILAALVALISGTKALRLTRAQFGSAVLLGLLLPAWGNGMVVLAQQHVASGLAALLAASVPLYVVVLRRVWGDRPSKITFVGVAIGLVGLAVLVFGGPSEGAHGTAWFGPWLVLLGALGWSFGTLLSTKLALPPNPFALAAVELVAGGVALAVAGMAMGERLDLAEITTGSWVAWGYLVLAGSLLAFSSYVYVLGRLPVSTVATYAYVNPVIAVLLGYLFAGERFGLAQLGGGLIVLVAVVLVVRAERPGPKVSVPAGSIPESCEVKR